MGSTARHDTTAAAKRGACASITIDVLRVGKLGTDMSSFERRGLNENAARCH